MQCGERGLGRRKTNRGKLRRRPFQIKKKKLDQEERKLREQRQKKKKMGKPINPRGEKKKSKEGSKKGK